nr:peptide,salivary low MW [Homo sapiens]
GPPPPPGKPQ